MWNASYVQKTLQLYLTGMGRWKDPRKYQKVTIAIARARCNKLEADPSLSTKPNRSHLDRLQKPYGPRSDSKMKVKCLNIDLKHDMPVLGLAGSHRREIWNLQKRRLKWQVRWVDQTQYPMIVVASLSAMPHSPAQIEVLHLFRCSTHTPSRGRVGKLRSGQWDEDENERKWRWGEDENEMKIT